MTTPMIKQQTFGPNHFVRLLNEFTVNGETEFKNLGDHPMRNWMLQVFGIDANGVLSAPTAWTVGFIGDSALCGSQVLVSHSSPAQKNGDVVFLINSPVTAIKLALSGLTLGPATNLVAVLEGSN